MRIRDTHVRASAAALVAALALATPAAGQSGGAPTPEQQDAAMPVDPAFTLSARRGAMLGRAVRVKGALPQAANRSVRIDARDASGLWVTAASAQADADGAFVATWVPALPGRYALRAVVDAGGDAQSASAPRSSVPRPLTVYSRSVASWYGPGFFGRRTACGQRLTRTTLGVAHRTLPCGTRVAILVGARSIVVPVIDRGPFVRGVHWDLTAAAASRVGLLATEPIGVATLNP